MLTMKKTHANKAIAIEVYNSIREEFNLPELKHSQIKASCNHELGLHLDGQDLMRKVDDAYRKAHQTGGPAFVLRQRSDGKVFAYLLTDLKKIKRDATVVGASWTQISRKSVLSLMYLPDAAKWHIMCDHR